MRRYCSGAGLTMLLGAFAVGAQNPPLAQASSRSYTAGRFAIELTTPTAAQIFLQSAAGGQMAREVVQAGGVAPGGIARKQLDDVTFTPITVRGEAAELLTAFRAALEQPAVSFDGRIVSMDFNGNIKSELSFTRARLTQIVLSALDASSKDATTVEMALVPELVRMSVDRGPYRPYKSQVEKAGLLGFQLRMPGLDDAMSHVERVESIRMMQNIAANAPGAAEYARSAPGRWQYGNIVVTLPLAHAEELGKWRQQLLAGNSAALEKTLDLHLFAGTKELLVLHASGVSLVSMRDMKTEANNESLHRVQVELVVQHWDVGQP